jgi:hypothetical protein
MTEAITLICAALVLAYALHVINHMSRHTGHAIRAAFIALAVAEFVLLAGDVLLRSALAGRYEVALLNAAVLLFVIFNRRRAGV